MKLIHTRLCTLRLDARSGDLIGLRWKRPALEAIREPRLGENFRLLLPRPGYEANYFTSREQKVSRIRATPQGVTCVYDSMRNSRERVDVAVQYHIRVVEQRLEFSVEVENKTSLPLAEVFFGIVGGQQGLGNRHDTESLVPGWYQNDAPGIFQNFQPGAYGGGNLGIRHSARGFLYPHTVPMSWMEFYNSKTKVGLYYGDHDPVSRVTALYFELRPFDKSVVIGDNWPTPADVPTGEPIGLTMGWLKFPHTRRGTFRSGPIALQVHRGDWREGSQLYRAWFDKHFPIPRKASWLRKEMAWQSVIMSNPEDVIIHRFKDLPRLASDAKKYGVTTFEICGWDVGGIDRGYPNYTPDPRLGTPAEFRQALAKIKAMGVHPVIFANVHVADLNTDWYRKKLHRFTLQGLAEENLCVSGWGEGTIGGRMGLRRSHMTVISPSHPEVKKLLVDQFADLVRDGADALQLDKTNTLCLLDFNPRLPTSPDRSLPEGMLTTFCETQEQCQKVNPDFALASELMWDRSFTVVDVSYMRLGQMDMPFPVLRYTFPEWTMTVFAENPGDFNIMNNGMRYGCVWAMAPRHYNDSMYEPLTRPLSRYVQELIRIRTQHKELLFHGRFRDTEGARVKTGVHGRYSVFEGMNGVGKAVVVVNFDDRSATATVNWPHENGTRVEVCQPFKKDRTAKLPVQLRLPPRTCAVIVAPQSKPR